jgi:hypothetical protein
MGVFAWREEPRAALAAARYLYALCLTGGLTKWCSGRSILEGYLQKVPVPTSPPWDPSSIRRIYYVGDHEPDLQGEKLPIVLTKYLSWDAFRSYLRTWSSLHDYLVKHPNDKDSEGRDIVDRLVKEVYEKGENLADTDTKAWKDGFIAEWPLALLLLKKAE